MLIMIHLTDVNEYMYATAEEYLELYDTLNYMNIKHDDCVIDDKVYRITWYNHIDEEWQDIWCSEETFDEELKAITDAEVEFRVTEYN